MDMNTDLIRQLPAVGRVLETVGAKNLTARFGHEETVAAVQTVVERLRAAVLAKEALPDDALSPQAVLREATARLEQSCRPILKPAVNATGILLHTGLGRAPMPEAARLAVASVAGCCNLQMDLTDGARLHREHIIRDLVCGLTGAEDVLLVNNNAAGTLLALRALAQGREVVVSRGELIEIGGAFRIPDILAESGCVMREVGTTNKTHLRDYERAIAPETAMLLKVHKSNYDIIGFTKEVTIGELAALGRARGVTVMDDLGCGALVDLRTFGLAHEMTMAESLTAGADLVLASTDKLIGGPQGGLILGKRGLIDTIRRHPLYRAMRVCKMTLAALEATLRLFKNPAQLAQTHPLYFMLSRTPDELMRQAETLAAQLRAQGGTGIPACVDSAPRLGPVAVVAHDAFLGGGSLPGQALPSFAVRIEAPDAAALARDLREAPVPVVPRVHQDALYLDMRTVMPGECAQVVASFAAVI
ncbi:MAG: L-seryl-tRNA(Sec) selenium transferase [Kiritimatiellaeota bacterium]|nr:L-seryl-tRNA(Sec) selenium transferase [Kiritimatiellota bacterium]